MPFCEDTLQLPIATSAVMLYSSFAPVNDSKFSPIFTLTSAESQVSFLIFMLPIFKSQKKEGHTADLISILPASTSSDRRAHSMLSAVTEPASTFICKLP